MTDGTRVAGLGGAGEARVRTFLIADVRGYTRFTRERGDEAAAGLAMRFAEVARECVAGFEGEVVGLRGDELAAAFGSPRQALQAAVVLQRRLAEAVRADPTVPLLVGVGVDAGESVVVEDGYRGAALNLAARLCSLAKAGEVLVSDTVEHLAGRQPEITFRDRGRQRVKGLERPVHFYQAVFPLDLPRLPTTTPRWTPRRLAGIAIAAAVIIAVGVAVAATRGGTHGPAAAPVRANSLAAIDIKTGRVVADVKLSSQPGQVVSGGRRVWVAEEQTDTVVRIDPKTLKSIPEGIAIDPAALAYGAGSLWAYDPVDDQAIRIAPNLNQDQAPTPFPLPACHESQAFPVRCLQGGIAVAYGSVWVGRALNAAHSLGVVWQLNAHKAIPTLTHTIRNVPAAEIVYGGGSIWTASPDSAAQIEPKTGQVLDHWNVPGGVLTGTNYEEPFGMTWADNFTWIVAENHALAQLGSNGTNATAFVGGIPLSPGSVDVAAGGGYLWVTNDDGTVTQIDLHSLKIVKTYRLDHPADGVAYTKNRVWVGVS